MACRKYKRKEYCNFYSVCTILLILIITAMFIYEYLVIQASYSMRIPVGVIFAILFFLVIASYIATSCTQPGKVPFYYGLTKCSIETPRKYCVICHNFKPERTHHCSVCAKCVMNMDHHCPWVNNCIGFHNRKFFIQFIAYLTIALVLISIVSLIFLIDDFREVFKTNQTDIHFALRLILFLFSCTMMVVLGLFLSMHFSMILDNTTTLQGMIKNRNEERRKEKKNDFFKQKNKAQTQQEEDKFEDVKDYDVGQAENLYQVFGENGFYWLLPLYGDGPKGNGIYWPKPSQTSIVGTGRKQNEYVSIGKA